MQKQSKVIKIVVFANEEKYSLETYTGEYRNLMELLRNSIYSENFGECGGKGRCCTCLIKFSCGPVELKTFQRNELSTLEKHKMHKPGNRLSCQIEVDQNLNNIVV
ncbi:MAG: hypothetical protein ABI207_09170, partial [Crocinitomicaceae bacterium]